MTIGKRIFGFLFAILLPIAGFSQSMTYRSWTTVTSCSSLTTIFDNGGPSGNYLANSRDTLTIVSNDPNNPYIEVAILAGSIDAGDTLYIYNAGTPDPQYGVSMGDLAQPWWNNTNNIIIGNWSFRANSLNPDNGAITLVFVSNGSTQDSGFEIGISCNMACQPIDARLDRILCQPPVTLESDGFYYMSVCPNTISTLKVGAESDVYPDNDHMYHQSHATSNIRWFIGETEISGIGDTVINYVFQAGYGTDVRLQIVDARGCPATYIDYVRVRTADNPIRSVQLFDDICSGTIIDSIRVGYDSLSVISIDTISNTRTSSLSFDSLLHLPDGPNCPGLPRCYDATVYFTDFAPGATLTNANDIVSICFTMEHSFIGDFEMYLICPNQQRAMLKTQAGGGTYFGGAIDVSGESVCNADPSYAGTGWNYCFSNNTALGFGYSQNSGGDINSGPTVSSGTGGTSIDSTNRTTNTNYYHPYQNFNNLIGCPLNGAWTLQICDQYGIDDGWIWEWTLALDPALMPVPWNFTVMVDTIYWNGQNLIPDPNDNSMASIDATIPGDFTYNFTLVDDYGCVYDSTFVVTVVETPTPELGDDYGICFGQSVTLDANYNTPGATYVWNGDPSISTPTYTVQDTGLYILEVTMRNDEATLLCVARDTIHLDIFPQPEASFSGTDLEGCEPLTVTLRDESTPALNYTYQWTILNEEGDTIHTSTERNPRLNFDHWGNYTAHLYVESEHGCFDDTTQLDYIIVYPQPNVDFTVEYKQDETGNVVPVPDKPEVICAADQMSGGTQINFINISQYDDRDNIEWSWTFGDGSNSSEFNPINTYAEWGTYDVTLTATNDHGCNSSKTYQVNIEAPLEFTNVLTPNGDGVNDVFAIKNMNPEFPNRLSIYDRWGKRIYDCENYQTYMKNGELYNADKGFTPDKFSDGVYYFTFIYENFISTIKYHSSVTFIR